MTKKAFSLLLTVLLICSAAYFLASCSSGKKKLAPGHCLENIDCPTGQACREGSLCEDIYFPAKDIKPY